MRTKLVLLFLILQVCFVYADEPLCQAEWSAVKKAAHSLENEEGASVERLLKVMEDERFVRLVNTCDLIYPGALQFYGHGFVVNYALNWLPARAGWVLEEMTFQDFGFSGNLPNGEELLKKVVELRKQGVGDVSMEEIVKMEESKVALPKFRRSAERARRWWKERGSGWTRLRGLQDALGSSSGRRQQAALSYLRYPDSSCRGLDLQSYRRLLLTSVKRLAIVGDPNYEGARDQACLLLTEVPNQRTFSIQGIAPGMAEDHLPKVRAELVHGEYMLKVTTSPFEVLTVTCDKSRVVLVEGDSLWENGKLLLKRGDSRATVSHVFTPLAPDNRQEFLGCRGTNCEVVLVFNAGKLVNVELHPVNSGSGPDWAH